MQVLYHEKKPDFYNSLVLTCKNLLKTKTKTKTNKITQCVSDEPQ